MIGRRWILLLQGCDLQNAIREPRSVDDWMLCVVAAGPDSGFHEQAEQPFQGAAAVARAGQETAESGRWQGSQLCQLLCHVS